MKIDVLLTPAGLEGESLAGRAAVVIDVLRACTTVVAALANGARGVVPVAGRDEARAAAESLAPGTFLLGGERDAVPLAGYDLGNAPTLYTAEKVAGRTIILDTTNGSGLFGRAAGADGVVAGALVNAAAVARALRTWGRDVLMVCAGWKGGVSLEDTLCAGLLVHLLTGGALPDSDGDGAHLALRLYEAEKGDVAGALAAGTHGRRLGAMGAGADVAFAARLDALPLVPILRGSALVPLT